MVQHSELQDWDAEYNQPRWRRAVGPAQQGVARRAAASGSSRVFPSVIISTSEDQLIVRAEVPGMKMEGFDISVSGDTLTVQGTRLTDEGLEGGWFHRRERESGEFGRAIRLPALVDGDRAEATYVSGVLTVLLPLKEAAKPQSISVRVAEG
jgi:HSP20 family protein